MLAEVGLPQPEQHAEEVARAVRMRTAPVACRLRRVPALALESIGQIAVIAAGFGEPGTRGDSPRRAPQNVPSIETPPGRTRRRAVVSGSTSSDSTPSDSRTKSTVK